MRCPYCNEEYDDNMEYCPNCGSDNPNVDQREIREEEQAKEQKTFATPIAPNLSTSDPMLQWSDDYTMEFETDDGNYTAHFDMKNKFEADAYHELQDIDGKKSGNGIIYISFAVIAGLILFFILRIRVISSVVGLVVGIVAVIVIFAIAVKASMKHQDYQILNCQKQMDYFMYKIQQQGGEILTSDKEKRTVCYKLNGVVKNVKFHYYEMGSRHHRGGWR
ncbi:MAG: zinc ribbon domain-containing protein [Clostridia bacterium]|nr:zinc ribbon domain-containing protein [Clostridia bacterium]